MSRRRRVFGAGGGGGIAPTPPTGGGGGGGGDPLATMLSDMVALTGQPYLEWWQSITGVVGDSSGLTSWTGRNGTVFNTASGRVATVQGTAVRGNVRTATPIALDHTTKGYLIVASAKSMNGRGKTGDGVVCIERNDTASAGGHPSRKISLNDNGAIYGDGAPGIGPGPALLIDTADQCYVWYLRANSIQGAAVQSYDQAITGSTALTAALPADNYHISIGRFVYGDYDIVDSWNNLDNQFIGIFPVSSSATDANIKLAVERIRAYWRATYPFTHNIKRVKIWGDSKSTTTQGGNWVGKLATLLGATYIVQNYALGGYRLGDLISDRDPVNDTTTEFNEITNIDAVARDSWWDTCFHDPTATKAPMHWIDLGLNDAQSETMTQAAYRARFQHYYDRRHAKGTPASRFVMAHCTDVADANWALFGTKLTAMEAAIAQVLSDNAGMAARPGTSVHLHTRGAGNDATYFSDGTHLTDAGGTEMANNVAYPYINAFAW